MIAAGLRIGEPLEHDHAAAFAAEYPSALASNVLHRPSKASMRALQSVT
jgi:hypothetical protein